MKVTKKLKDNFTVLTTKLNDANYFLLRKRKCKIILSLKFEKRFNMKIDSYVTEKLLDFNSNPKGNPYVGQDKIGENKFIINKVKILNHRWIIAYDLQYLGRSFT
jgi:Holliday junction resolvase